MGCLEKLGNKELEQYMLQLVQSLKFECYLDSDLARFILKRAWRNRHIGHFLYFTLSAEIDNKSSKVVLIRYRILIEGYLFGNIPHLHELHKQNESLIKMKVMNERVKRPEFGIKEIKTLAKKALREIASQTSFAEALSNVECPLDPNIKFTELVCSDIKVMNSKMRPLWLVFKREALKDKMSVIYKNGDDLRQDMLTLQIISIMDHLWKSEGLDLKMTPYRCLATGSNSGLIEVVSPANTVANIQKEKRSKITASSCQQTLLEWLEEKAKKHSMSRDEIIQNFTYSCAGYCVATYVLGVGDRHSDNIMVTEHGKLFHNAFLTLRKKGHLFITLFALMLESGLPE